MVSTCKDYEEFLKQFFISLEIFFKFLNRFSETIFRDRKLIPLTKNQSPHVPPKTEHGP